MGTYLDTNPPKDYLVFSIFESPLYLRNFNIFTQTEQTAVQQDIDGEGSKGGLVETG